MAPGWPPDTEFPAAEADVLIMMGSQSDAVTVKHARNLLDALGVTHQSYIASAHRTPKRVEALVTAAEQNGVKAIIAAAGMSAMLPGAASSFTYVLPVFGIAVEGRNGLDNLAAVLAMTQMPGGVPAPICGLGKAGAIQAALSAAAVVGLVRPDVREKLRAHRQKESDSVPERPDYDKP